MTQNLFHSRPAFHTDVSVSLSSTALSVSPVPPQPSQIPHCSSIGLLPSLLFPQPSHLSHCSSIALSPSTVLPQTAHHPHYFPTALLPSTLFFTALLLSTLFFHSPLAFHTDVTGFYTLLTINTDVFLPQPSHHSNFSSTALPPFTCVSFTALPSYTLMCFFHSPPTLHSDVFLP